MSAGPLVASGVGVLLLVVTAYILIGGTLTTTEVMVEAQTNLAMYQEVRMRTAIEIQNAAINDHTLHVQVKNTGSEPIVNIALIDVYLLIKGTPTYIPYVENIPEGKDSIHWDDTAIDPDHIHPGAFDPGEILTISIPIDPVEEPRWVQVVTPNGVYSSAYIGE